MTASDTTQQSSSGKEQVSLLATRSSRDLEPWERREDENDRDWGCFLLYRDMHPSVRSIARAFVLYQQNRTDPATEAEAADAEASALAYKAPSWFEQIATNNQWTVRTRAYDEWRDRDQIERLQSTRVRYLVEVAGVGRDLRMKGAQALENLRVVAYEQVIDEHGDVTTVATSTLSPSAIVQLVRAGAELERSAIGLDPPAGSGPGISVQIANVIGGPASGHLPMAPDDEALLVKVLEVAAATKPELLNATATPVLAPGEEAKRGAR